ncbi:hypothetical protein GX51_06170 [Blastomyces parvus]|uniref:Uncharacterized protein n=1 Tax=Blastomyces parvus TaxID=2060905 RepID=A0A2B7WT05_9EURO|nr:hypothetical protein GX51_06170 [Blastomyces parvus]
MSRCGLPGAPLLDGHLESIQADNSAFLELALDTDVLSSECRTDTFHTESSSKSAFVGQHSYLNPAVDLNGPPLTPLNSSPAQFYPPATNPYTQEFSDDLNFSQWCHDTTYYASPCPDPHGEISEDQDVLDRGPLGSLSHFIMPLSPDTPSSPSWNQFGVPFSDSHEDPPPDLSQMDFETLVNFHDLSPDPDLAPTSFHQPEQKKRERSDTCLAKPTFKRPRKKKPVLVRKYDLRKLPSRKSEDPKDSPRPSPDKRSK